MFERRHQNLIPSAAFAKRMAAHIGIVVLLIVATLLIGIAGYHWLAGLSWIDALLNASMILGGMGPVDRLTSDPAKWFASAYALFSGLVFIGIMGIIFAPIMHRVLHAFHIDSGD